MKINFNYSITKYFKSFFFLGLSQYILFSQSIVTDVSRHELGNILKIQYFNTSFKIVQLVKIETYFSNGQLQMFESYHSGIKNGEYFEYFNNGKLKSKGHFLNGNANGIWADYYSSGAVKTMSYANDNGKNRRLNKWYANGNKKKLDHIKMEKKMEYVFHGMKMI